LASSCFGKGLFSRVFGHACGHGRGFPLAPAPFGGRPLTRQGCGQLHACFLHCRKATPEGFQRASGKTRSVSSTRRALSCPALVKPPTCGSLSPTAKCPQGTRFPPVPLARPLACLQKKDPFQQGRGYQAPQRSIGGERGIDMPLQGSYIPFLPEKVPRGALGRPASPNNIGVMATMGRK